MAKKNEETNGADWDQIEIGDQVKHPKWGTGTVLFRSGMGEAAKAIVVFPEEGQKKLMLKFAGLEKIGTTSLKSVEKLKAETAPAPVAVESEEEEVALDLGNDEADVFDEEEADVAGFDDDEEEEFGGSDDDDLDA